MALRRSYAQTVENSGAYHTINYVIQALEILSVKGHHNYTIGSKGTAILLTRLSLPIWGVALGRVCMQPAKPASLGWA